jgi:hypothetical protein
MTRSHSWLLLLFAGCASQPAVKVVEAREVGLTHPSSLILGRDGGGGLRLWDRMVFFFGDTFVSTPDRDGSTFHSNSFSFTDDTNAADGIDRLEDRLDDVGSPLPLIMPTADEAAYNAAHRGDTCAEQPCGARWATWAGDSVFDAENGRALIAYELIDAKPGAWNFEGRGRGLVSWSDFNSPAQRPEPMGCPTSPTVLFCEGEPWGTALVVNDSFLYAFGCAKDACSVARAPLASVFDRASWTAWDGATWGALKNAKSLFASNSLNRIFYNSYAHAWMAVTSAPLSNDVVYRTAPALTGPWSEQVKLFTADHKAQDDGWTYDAMVQPDYSEEDGRVIYVTWSRPTGLFRSEHAVERIVFQ